MSRSLGNCLNTLFYFIKDKFFSKALLLLVSINPVFNSIAHAEIVTDGSLGQQASLSGNMIIPESLGKLSGKNLFHSFETFNINQGESATFTTQSSLNNVISRVTGGNLSTIDGLLKLQANGNPAFFLINPAGIVFKDGTSIDVPGAFHVSTSERLTFEDGAQMYADLENTSSFSSATPEAFGFLNNQSSSIVIEEAAFISNSDNNINLSAGDIEINGFIVNDRGDINIHAQGNHSGQLALTGDIQEGFGEIEMNNALVGTKSTESEAAGSISISAGQMYLRNQTYVKSKTENLDQDSGRIDIKVTETLNVSNGSQIATENYFSGDSGQINVSANDIIIDGNELQYATGIFTYTDGQGNAGNIKVSSDGDLIIEQGGGIGSESWGDGLAGQVNVISGNILISQINSEILTGIYSDSYGKGNAGNVIVTSFDKLGIFDGGFISSVAFDNGNAGNVLISAQTIGLDKLESNYFNGITSQTQGAGNAGNIEINADRIGLFSNSFINSDSLLDVDGNSQNKGNAGIVSINADYVLVDGSTISSDTQTVGDAGSINLEVTDSIEIINTGSISSKTSNQGNAGSIIVSSNNIKLNDKSSVSSDSEGAGSAGSINLFTNNTLVLTNEAYVTSNAYGRGDAGSVKVATENLHIEGTGLSTIVTLIGSDTFGEGNAGSVEIEAFGEIVLKSGGQISSNTFGSGKAGDVIVKAEAIQIDRLNGETFTGITSQAQGIGDAGDVVVEVSESLSLYAGGNINSSTFFQGKAGSVTISANDIYLDAAGADTALTSTAISSDTYGSGDAGSVYINAAHNLMVQNGAFISSAAFLSASGNAGLVSIDSGNIYLNRNSADYFTGITSQTLSNGNAGLVSINNSGLISINNGAYINSNTFGPGNAGGVEIYSNQIEINGYDSDFGTAISSDSGSAINSANDLIGAAGNVDITVLNDLYVFNGGKISSTAYAQGDAGVVNINSSNIFVDGKDAINFTEISSNTLGAGNAGSIYINAINNLDVRNAGYISSSTYSIGDAGSVLIDSGNIYLLSNSRAYFTGIASQTQSDGNAGLVRINNAGLISVLNGAYINSTTFGSGNAGGVEINSNQIEVIGYESEYGSAISSDSGTVLNNPNDLIGTAGNVDITVLDYLYVADGGKISSTAYALGDAGVVNINSSDILVDGQNAINLTQVTSNTYGAGNAGSIYINAAYDLEVINGASISSSTYSIGNAGSVLIDSGNIYLNRNDANYFTGITSQTQDEGDAGLVTINNSGLISIYNGAYINSNTFGSGNAGGVQINSNQVEVIGYDSDFGTAISSDSGSINNSADDLIGSAGNVDITVFDYLYVADGGTISSATYAQGDAGVVNIISPEISLDGLGANNLTGILSDTEGAGNAGSVYIESINHLEILNGAFISSLTFSSGNAGTVTVKSNNLLIDGSNGVDFTGITSQTQGIGTGGNVTVDNLDTIELINLAYINSSAFDDGDAGTVNIKSGNLIINAENLSEAASVSSDAYGTGDAGSVSIELAGTLHIKQHGFVSSKTEGLGFAGSIDINANQIILEDQGSSVSASADFDSSGQTGSLSIAASNHIDLKNGAQISIENNAFVLDASTIQPTELTVVANDIEIKDSLITAASTGNIDASNININSSHKTFLDNGFILTSAQDGNGGKVSLTGSGLLFLNNSAISTSVFGFTGNGGDIFVDMDSLVLNTGFIQANTVAENAFGGDIIIQVPVLAASGNSLITGGDEQLDFSSDVYGYNVIQAAAPDGVSGNIEITAPNLDLSGSLNVLGVPFFDSGGLGRSPCETTFGSSLSVTGRGYLPDSSELPLSIRGSQGESVPVNKSSRVDCVL